MAGSAVQDIDSDRRRYLRLARIDMWISQGLLWVALCSSAVASVGLLADVFTAKQGGIIAALPVVFGLVENTMAFNARSDIHWLRARRLKAIQRDEPLKSQAEITTMLNDLDKEMDELWDKEIKPRQIGFWQGVSKKSDPT